VQLRDIVDAVAEVLGADVLGVYLHGSAVAGGLHHRSDLDLLVIVDREPDPDVRAALVSALLPVGRRAGKRADDRSLELTVVARSAVVPWRYPPRQAFQYGEWEREAYLAGFVPAPRSEPDLVVLLSTAVASGVALAGPPIGALVAPVPATDLRQAMVDLIPRLDGDLETDTANVILTMARVWATLETGEILPKDEAASWALERAPGVAGPVVERARGVYLGTAEDAWDDLGEAVRPAADALLAAIRDAATRPSRIAGSDPSRGSTNARRAE
jgi:predicted nucleotidyltransferase